MTNTRSTSTAANPGTTRTALVTGAGNGIGRAIAVRLARDGYRVVIGDIDLDKAQQLADELGGRAARLDIADEASVRAFVAGVAEPESIDILVNNAGIHMQKLLVETTKAEWERIQGVNSTGTFLMCREVAPRMMRAERGRIINIATRLGFGNPYSSAYMASKNAIWGLTQCLAVELAAYGITVNAVAPGHVGVNTGMEAAFRQKAQNLGQSWETFERGVIKSIPMGRWCTPEDVAGAVAYIASDDARFVTAELLNVTGGFSGYSVAVPKPDPT
jgi:NAD(P)-dependent dehydrogenase (short-subunit alcohol dehydrogenase family)